MRSGTAQWALLGCTLWALARPALAGDDLQVPVPVQVKLLSKVAGYDRNLSKRSRAAADSGQELGVGILLRPKHPLSVQIAGQAKQALRDIASLGGFAHREEELAVTDLTQVAAQCATRGWAILYVMPGFSEEEIVKLAKSLEASSILTIAATASDVRHGIVLGFDLVSSKPKLLVHLKQARRQQVDFSSDLLSLSEVVE